ncbi:MAG: CotH kinase family protein [Brachymonas sp.]
MSLGRTFRVFLSIGLLVLLTACGGGGAGSANPISPSNPPASEAALGWPVRAVTGVGHITLYWESQPGAQAYEVWTQPNAGGSAGMSRRFEAGANTITWAHTVTELTPDSEHRVWVRLLPSAGAASDSQVLTRQASFTSGVGASNVPSFMPERVDGALLVVDTDGAAPILDRENYLLANFNLYASGADRATGTTAVSGRLEIRGRGNSTWTNQPKKPYRLKLTSSASLLGMPANRHWVLLANHSDKTSLRNRLAFEVSRRMGMAYTPRSRGVELILNGQYLGAYDLVEHVRTGSQRVNITPLGSSAPDDVLPNLSGGYLLDVDRNDDETSFVSSTCSMAVRIHAPETPSAAQLAYLRDYVNQAEATLYSSTFADPTTGYAAMINVDSFVDWYLHSELMYNIDAFRFSTYLVKDCNGKLSMGPVWDFDLAMGNFVGYFPSRPGRTDGDGGATTRCWMRRLLQDPAFVQRVRLRWQQLRSGSLADLAPFLQTEALAQWPAQANNFRRWPVLDKPTWQNVVVTGSYGAEVEYLEWWIQRRLVWMDGRWK